MTEQILSAGFGGQGVLLLGQLLAYSGMREGKNVSWMPSYGPEMRGGTANCSVIVSDEEIGSPVIDEADTVIVMNRPSLDKYESKLRKGGRLFINSSLIDKKATRDDIEVYYVPVSDIANELGNARVANIVMLGAYLELTHLVKPETAIAQLKESFGEKKAHLIPLNEQAIEKGAAFVRK
ncbi:MAG: 2-oxoacid:ferredoxin oxidoreductase subunit gamma [Clostridiales bacterium]|nr:2-oxoacid:ferredoxin oxidoreductase subunit gamma [Clostridiales bacterium]MBP3941844.1 2-oxoacid:acceptor oxidoreductase family protein [Christensenellaceae bacterium]MBR3843587.1 2-oxoacid:acceptor oxidoreductase family protein [Christensenellaceae bacterium]